MLDNLSHDNPMPSLTRREKAQLYIAVAAAVNGAVNRRARPVIAARLAHERALAAVEVARTNGKRTQR